MNDLLSKISNIQTLKPFNRIKLFKHITDNPKPSSETL